MEISGAFQRDTRRSYENFKVSFKGVPGRFRGFNPLGPGDKTEHSQRLRDQRGCDSSRELSSTKRTW